jgi:hypothetical protein
MNKIELLPCPYCGGPAELREGEECAYVQCLHASYHRGPFVDGDNNAANEAITAWNTRAAHSVMAGQIAEWRNRCEYLLACIDQSNEAGAPVDERDPEDKIEEL